VLICTNTGSGAGSVRAASTSARVGSTRERVSSSTFAGVGRRSTSSPARFTTALPASSDAHGPTVRPSHATCR
jgi:hypothetical protein